MNAHDLFVTFAQMSNKPQLFCPHIDLVSGIYFLQGICASTPLSGPLALFPHWLLLRQQQKTQQTAVSIMQKYGDTREAWLYGIWQEYIHKHLEKQSAETTPHWMDTCFSGVWDDICADLAAYLKLHQRHGTSILNATIWKTYRDVFGEIPQTQLYKHTEFLLPFVSHSIDNEIQWTQRLIQHWQRILQETATWEQTHPKLLAPTISQRLHCISAFMQGVNIQYIHDEPMFLSFVRAQCTEIRYNMQEDIPSHPKIAFGQWVKDLYQLLQKYDPHILQKCQMEQPEWLQQFWVSINNTTDLTIHADILDAQQWFCVAAVYLQKLQECQTEKHPNAAWYNLIYGKINTHDVSHASSRAIL